MSAWLIIIACVALTAARMEKEFRKVERCTPR